MTQNFNISDEKQNAINKLTSRILFHPYSVHDRRPGLLDLHKKAKFGNVEKKNQFLLSLVVKDRKCSFDDNKVVEIWAER